MAPFFVRALAALVLIAWTAYEAAAQSSVALQVGVVPNVSARVILGNYQPMRAYLEKRLGQPVDIVTAPDFKAFHQRTMAGEYDLVVTPAHMGRVAQTDGGYRPLATYQPNIQGLLVMAKARPVKDIRELRDGALALANPQSLVVMRGMSWLRERGLNADADFSIVKTLNQDSLAQSLLSGEGRLAMLSNGEYRQIAEATRAQLEVFATFTEVPGFLLLSGGKWPATQSSRLKALLLQFPDSEEGRQFFAATGFKGLRDVQAAELQALDSVVPQTRALFSGG